MSFGALSAKRRRTLCDRTVPVVALTLIAARIGAQAAPHDNDGDSRFAPGFVPGFLVFSRSVYDNVSGNAARSKCRTACRKVSRTTRW